MKQCPKCGIDHGKNGTHCSRACANSRQFSEASKIKKSAANNKFYSSLTIEEKVKRGDCVRAKYNYAEQQRKSIQTKIDKSWSRPYEEMSVQSLRKRLIHEHNYCCDECGQTNVWNGKPLTLEMDHIDGNPRNNVISNLRILCPHCHSQTDTFRARNIKAKREKLNIQALTDKLLVHKFATPALNALGLKTSRLRMQIANSILEELRIQKKI
jgi:5-methylcytosine-specific restriction endonuclease McrA